MPDPLPDVFIVRILGPGAQPVGLGALVDDLHVVTCAHVVNAALGLTARAQPQPADPVMVDFPLAQQRRAAADHPPCEAVVARWLPPPRDGAAGDDLAGLRLAGPAPAGAAPAQLAVNTPPAGRTVRVFGYPGVPPRPDGVWVTTTVRGRVGSGQLQLDSGPDSALRVQPGFSGSPVFDDTTGRVVGLLASAAAGRAQERDSYAIGVDRLRLAWPEILNPRWQRTSSSAQADGSLVRGHRELTVLHLSDMQFGGPRIFGGNGLTSADRALDTLFGRLHDDLSRLADDHGLRPDLLIVTGDLAERGLRSEFRQVTEFLSALSEAAEIPRRHVAVIPGNHDVNRKACEAHFAEQESDEKAPVPPYFPKWRQFAAAFKEFYADVNGVTFTPDEPWTLFEMPELAVVVAGLNSTMAESHRDSDHYGWVGEHQLRWFADRLAHYRGRGWLRLAAVHHNVVRAAVLDEENLRDADDLDRLVGQPGLANLLLHGHTHDGKLHRLPSGLVALSTGSAAVAAPARPAEVPSQYQLITVRHDGFTRHARQYALGQHRWIGDTRISPTGSDWRDSHSQELSDVQAVFPHQTAGAEPATAGTQPGSRDRHAATGPADTDGSGPSDRGSASPQEDFLDWVADATRARFPAATITARPAGGYLRVSRPLPGGGAEQWPVGAVDGPVTEVVLHAFVTQVHALFASADPSVRSEFIYGGPPASDQLLARARQDGVRLRSFIEYQGLLDLRPLMNRQSELLASDRIYPAHLYVSQRYRIAGGSNDICAGLLEQATTWLSAHDARLVMVLGDFGRGKTSFLRQLARTLPGELPGVFPVLVELRSLEKAPTLDELLAQHLVRQGVEDINPAKLRYMIRSGRIALLFDGFDELELRVGYDNAADYLRVLLESVAERAKVVLTSRTQHFRSTDQVRTALGERVEALACSRVVVLEDFSEEQMLQFLANLYEGDNPRARARFDLLSDIEDLRGLAHNPRMLAFIANLDDDRLKAVQRQEGRISAAELYKEIIDFWLAEEAKRHQHRRGVPSIDKKERLQACTALALRLWTSKDPTIGLADLSEEVSATLSGLAERGYSGDQASHSIGSGSLLVSTDDEEFAFVHQSIMEWLVSAAAADGLDDPVSAQILATRRMSKLMIDFFGDLAGHIAARRWAASVLADSQSPQAAKQNALAIQERVLPPGEQDPADSPPKRQSLAGVDLRGQDLAGGDLRQANLRGANLRGMRLEGADFSGADLSGADLTGGRLVRGSLRGAILAGSRWDRAALLGTEGLDELTTQPELQAAAVAGRDRAEVMIQRQEMSSSDVALSPDCSLLAIGWGEIIEIVDVADGRPLRILQGHTDSVWGVAFSPDGTLLATASGDRTARLWDVATGTARSILHGHTGKIWGLAFSPDGTLLATASGDRTARLWDVATGTARATLQGHADELNGVAFSPDGTLLATASDDNTACLWDLATGAIRITLRGHTERVRDVEFSPDGTLLATASDDETARLWDLTNGTPRTTLQGHTERVWDVEFSPDGSLLATASDDGTARLWDLATGTPRTTLQSHTLWVRGVAFSTDGTLLATASDNNTARLWDLPTGTARTTLQSHTDKLRGIAFSRDGTMLATASGDRTARLWNVATGTARTTLQGHADELNGVAFSPDGSLLATASDDSTARLWNVATGTPRTTLQGHTNKVQGVAFSPDGTLLATASADRSARLWDLAAGTPRPALRSHSGALNGVAFSPDATLLATASDDSTARLWDVATGTPRTTLQGHANRVQGVAFSPDGTLLATASDDSTARLWDVATGTAGVILQGHAGALSGVVFSPDGTLLATASGDGTACLWDVATGKVGVTLIALPDNGYATLVADGYKLEGDPANHLWWVIKLCRFAPGELDPYVQGLRQIPAGTSILPL
jgi:WD40 repeat protein/3',5'-cyclic AMP phosphodiesterase CpdA